jgi:hypothetical protein
VNYRAIDPLLWRVNDLRAGGLPLGDSLFSVFPNPPKVSEMLDVADVYTYDTLADVL